MQRRHAIAVRSLGIGSRCEQKLHRCQVAPVRGPMQRRHAIDVGRIDIDALLQQGLHSRKIAALRGSYKTNVADGRVGRRRENRKHAEYEHTLAHYSSILPLLSPYLSTGMPATSSRVNMRFESGVVSLTRMWRLPFTFPAAPPTVSIGRFVWMCWLPLLMPLP